MLLFMLFALSRLTFSTDTVTSESGGFEHDPEFRIGICDGDRRAALIVRRHLVGGALTWKPRHAQRLSTLLGGDLYGDVVPDHHRIYQ